MNDHLDGGDAEAALRARLADLIQQHGDLDVAVNAIAQSAMPDMLVIGRLKRKKLALKDEITRLQDMLTPDIIA
ncbi:MAG: YdcH family protein [Phenylobacterium sp.]|uniref:YdcH family protein n=1 Tax=Phenylobacterium sp. TaxID=1871053 RepID=UPI00391CEA7F